MFVSSLSYSLRFDRGSQVFNLGVEYYIDGYSDPETSEYFGNTSWSYTASRFPSGSLGGAGNFTSEGDTLEIGLVYDTTPGLYRYTISFTAFNTFSGASIAQNWNVFSAAYATSDQFIVGTASGVDILIGSDFDDLIRAAAGNDLIDAGGGDDLIDAGAGNDIIDGGLGSDIMAGNVGDDTYYVDSTGDVVAERTLQGTDTVYASVSYWLTGNVERLILVGPDARNGTGNADANQIYGNEQVNLLIGLDGGDELYGNGGDDRLVGGEGNDKLDGGEGRDRMEGGNGDDTYTVNLSGDQVIELPGGGTDTVRVTGLSGYNLGADVENLEFIGTGNFAANGNAMGNIMRGGAGNDMLNGGLSSDALYGGDGNDRLIGGPGADALYGGNGVDIADYATSAAAVTVALGSGNGSGGDAQGDMYIGVDAAIGSNLDDTLIGNAIANTFWGGAGNDRIGGAGGNDTIFGGAGADILDGGTGIDTLSYAGSAVGVNVDLSVQLGTAHGGEAEGDELSNFENVVGSNGDDHLAGDAFANRLVGGLGADTINGNEGNDGVVGGAGADTMDGGAGIDTLSYDTSTTAIEVNLALGFAAGGDATGDSFVNFERATGGSGNDQLTGNDGDNVLSGGAGADRLDGAGGNDVVIGGAGGDQMDGGLGLDTLSYQGSTAGGVVVDLAAGTANAGDAQGDTFTGFEFVTGSELGDGLYGDAGINFLAGGGGFDLLDGRGGNDRLTGGAQADTFVFGSGYGNDTIVDFDFSAGEVIQLALGTAFDSFAEVMAVAMAQGPSGENTVLKFNATTSLTLLGVKTFQLSGSDFEFVA